MYTFVSLLFVFYVKSSYWYIRPNYHQGYTQIDNTAAIAGEAFNRQMMLERATGHASWFSVTYSSGTAVIKPIYVLFLIALPLASNAGLGSKIADRMLHIQEGVTTGIVGISVRFLFFCSFSLFLIECRMNGWV